MTHNRRSFLKILGVGLLAASAPAALFWHEWNIDRIKAELEKRLQARMERDDFMWNTHEIEAHKQAGGWPEYQT